MNKKEFFEAIRLLTASKVGYYKRKVESDFESGYYKTREKFDERNLIPVVRIQTHMRYGQQIHIGMGYLPQEVDNQKGNVEYAGYGVHRGDRIKEDFTEVYLVTSGPGSVQLFNAVVSFVISPYPACCGLKMFHNFSTPLGNAELTDEQKTMFYDMMEYVLKHIHKNHMSLYSARLEAVFVGHRSAKPRSRTVPEKEMNEGTQFVYSLFRDFFHKKAAKVDSRTFYNYNSGNMLEKSEALFDSKMFPMH